MGEVVKLTERKGACPELVLDEDDVVEIITRCGRYGLLVSRSGLLTVGTWTGDEWHGKVIES